MEEPPAAPQEVSHTDHHQHEPLHRQETTSNVSTIPSEPEKPVVVTEHSSIVPRDEEGTAEGKPSVGKFSLFPIRSPQKTVANCFCQLLKRMKSALLG